jgi:hypothetical protein
MGKTYIAFHQMQQVPFQALLSSYAGLVLSLVKSLEDYTVISWTYCLLHLNLSYIP